jgi:hypothetical protein
MPAKAGIQFFLCLALGPRWSLPSGKPKARPVGGDERTGVLACFAALSIQ